MAENQEKGSRTRMGGGMSADKWKLSMGLMAGPSGQDQCQSSSSSSSSSSSFSSSSLPASSLQKKPTTEEDSRIPGWNRPASVASSGHGNEISEIQRRPTKNVDVVKLMEDYRRTYEELKKTQERLQGIKEESTIVREQLEMVNKEKLELIEQLSKERQEKTNLETQLINSKLLNTELTTQRDQALVDLQINKQTYTSLEREVLELRRYREEAELKVSEVSSTKEKFLKELLDDRRALDAARSEFEKARFELTRDREALWIRVSEGDRMVQKMFEERLVIERELAVQNFSNQTLQQQLQIYHQQLTSLQSSAVSGGMSGGGTGLGVAPGGMGLVMGLGMGMGGLGTPFLHQAGRTYLPPALPSSLPPQIPFTENLTSSPFTLPTSPLQAQPSPPSSTPFPAPLEEETKKVPEEFLGSFASLPSAVQVNSNEGSTTRYIAAGKGAQSSQAALLKNISPHSSPTIMTPLAVTGIPTSALKTTKVVDPPVLPSPSPPSPIPSSAPPVPSSPLPPLPSSTNSTAPSRTSTREVPDSAQHPLVLAKEKEKKTKSKRGFLGHLGKLKNLSNSSSSDNLSAAPLSPSSASSTSSSPNLFASIPSPPTSAPAPSTSSMSALPVPSPPQSSDIPLPSRHAPKLGAQPEMMKKLMMSMQQKHFTFARDIALEESSNPRQQSQYGQYDISRFLDNADQVIKIQRFVRKWLVKKRMRFMIAENAKESRTTNTTASSREQPVAEVEAEILSTEKTYVSSLYLLIMEFMQPIKLSGLVKDDDIRGIFSNIEVIYRCNSILLKDIEQCLNCPPPRLTSIGRIFLNLAPYLKLYVEYVNNYSNAITVLEKIKQSKVVSTLFERLQKKSTNPLFNITFLLVQPVQRIPRYCLLLNELIKRTSQPSSPPITGDSDYELLASALSAMKGVADTINESKRLFDQRQKLAEVSGRIDGNRLNLVENHRVWVREGTLEVMQEDDTKPRELYVFLFNDLLLFTRKSILSSLGGLLKCKPFIYDSHINLYSAFVSSDEPDEHSFRILYPLCTEGLILIAPSSEEKTAWKTAVVTQVTRLIETGATEDSARDDYLRRAAKSGTMNRKARLGWKAHYVELKGSTLYVFKSQNETTPWRSLQLHDFALIPDVEIGKRPNCFKLASSSSSSSTSVSASSSSLPSSGTPGSALADDGGELQIEEKKKLKEYVLSLNSAQDYADWLKELAGFTRKDGLLDVWQI